MERRLAATCESVCLTVTFRIDHRPSAGQIYLQWWPTSHLAQALEGASYSYKALSFHTDTLNYHRGFLHPHSFAIYYNMVGFNRHKYMGADLELSSYCNQMGSSLTRFHALTSSHSP